MVSTLETRPETVPLPSQALDDPDRLSALGRSGLMDSPAEDVFDRLTRLAARLLDVPVSLVSLVDDQRQFFKSACGLGAPWSEARQTPLSHSFCQHVVLSDAPLIIHDARRDARVCDNLAIRDLDVVAYLGIPLHAPDGQPLGSFCAIDSKPRDWTDDELSLLSDLASAAQSEIGLRLTLDETRRAVEARDLLMGELNHRVKNLFAMMSGMIGLTARNSADAADMAERLKGRVAALAHAHSMIEPAVTGAAGSSAGAELHALAHAILAPHREAGEVVITGDPMPLDPDSGAQLSLVLHELATNAAKYGGLSDQGGSLALDWSLTDNQLVIGWTETHPRPPVSEPTKATKSFGTRLMDGAVQSHMGGTLTRHWAPDGLRVSIVVPRDRVAPKG
jgi:two-component sensor histidine kinase